MIEILAGSGVALFSVIVGYVLAVAQRKDVD